MFFALDKGPWHKNFKILVYPFDREKSEVCKYVVKKLVTQCDLQGSVGC